MKQERKEAIWIMSFSVLWIIVAVILFLCQVHYRVRGFIDSILGNGLFDSLLNVLISLIWIIIYFGGFCMFFGGLKQLVTGKRLEALEKKQ